MSDCPGRIKCHGPASWCPECGDVDLVCDDPNCEVHARFAELERAELQARLNMDNAKYHYQTTCKAWAEASAKLHRFKTGNVVMVARKADGA